MKIYSKFKDYYDCMQSYYRDDMMYIRNRIEVKKEDYRFRRYDYYINSRLPFQFKRSKIKKLTENWHYDKYSIGFCGKIYTCYKISSTHGMWEPVVPPKFCYSFEDFKQYYPNESHELIDAFGPKGVLFGEQWVDWTKPQMSDSISQRFVDNKCPIFVEYNDKTVYNDCLKDFNFQRVFDPALAYQELMMYFGSVLAAPEKPIPVIDDVTMAEAKGFDKYSFRKDKRS